MEIVLIELHNFHVNYTDSLMKIFYGLIDNYQNTKILYLSVHLNNKQTPKKVDFSKLHGPRRVQIIMASTKIRV